MVNIMYRVQTPPAEVKSVDKLSPSTFIPSIVDISFPPESSVPRKPSASMKIASKTPGLIYHHTNPYDRLVCSFEMNKFHSDRDEKLPMQSKITEIDPNTHHTRTFNGESSQSHIVQTCTMHSTKLKRKPLVVLDLNGVLCYRLRVSKNVAKRAPNFGLERFRVNQYIVYIRPFAREFIKHCLNDYQLGFYTSTTKANAEPILRRLIDESDWNSVKFFWYRDHTVKDPDIGRNPLTPTYSTIKTVKAVLDVYPDYRSNDILMCDDSVQKLRFVAKKNQLLVRPFDLTYKLKPYTLRKDLPVRSCNSKNTRNEKIRIFNFGLLDGELLRLINRINRRVYGINSPDNSYRCRSIA